jgi:hypothetical protein
MKSSTCLRWVVLVTVSWLVACGGTSSRGRGGGSAGTGTGGEANVGTVAGGSNAETNGGAGSNPKGGSGTGAAAVTGGMPSGAGTGGGAAPRVQRCMVQEDCPGVDELPEDCGDGTFRGNAGYCDEFSGTCKRLGDMCPAKCADDRDCPQVNLTCTECNDGTRACPTNECVGGRCQTIYPGCGGYDPCKDRICGYYCTSCGPDEDCLVGALSFCNDRGKCQAGLARCGAGSCATAKDCGASPANCVACTNDTCAAPDCVNNQCVLACPPDTSRLCKAAYECPTPAGPCTMCPNGTCAVPACLQNVCELVCPL